MTRRMVLLSLTLLLVTSCAKGGFPGLGRESDSPQPNHGLRLDPLGDYRASFLVHFEGEADWEYRLETVSHAGVVEKRLHLAGLPLSKNPGDVRLVNKDGVNWMRGSGTDDECMRFPDEFDVGPTFLTPNDIIPPAEIRAPFVRMSEERIAGRSTAQYATMQEDLGDWKAVTLGIWLDEKTGATMRYDIRASGPDPLFGYGEGILEARFEVLSRETSEIEDIPDCEIPFPMPTDASKVFKLADLVAFESALSMDDMVAFYQSGMRTAGWKEESDPEGSEEATLLTYIRREEVVQIKITQLTNGSSVEILPFGP